MTDKFYIETLRSVLGCSIYHYLVTEPSKVKFIAFQRLLKEIDF